MVGYEKITVGIVLIIISALLFISAAWGAYNYYDGVDTINEKKEIRDAMRSWGTNTNEIDEEIKDDEEALKIKQGLTGICSTIGIILLIIGIVLVVKWRKEKKSEVLYPVPQPLNAPYPMHGAKNYCPTCGKELSYVPQFHRYFCHNCQKYA